MLKRNVPDNKSFKPIDGSVFYFPLGDCTNNGISKKEEGQRYKDLLLVPEGYKGELKSQGGGTYLENQTLVLKCRDLRDEFYYYAEPYNQDRKHWMMGGNYLKSCDSRFPCHYPVPIHDRRE